MKKLKKSTPVIQEEELIEWNRYKRYLELISKDNERRFSKGEIVASIRGRNFGDLIRYDKKPQLSNSKVFDIRKKPKKIKKADIEIENGSFQNNELEGFSDC